MVGVMLGLIACSQAAAISPTVDPTSQVVQKTYPQQANVTEKEITPSASQIPEISSTPAPTNSVQPELTSTHTVEVLPTLRPTLAPDEWMTLPVVPTVSDVVREIFRQGQEIGRNTHVFSKVGDCQNITTYFFAHFEDPDLYHLGEYEDLQITIDWYHGSFGRESVAVKGGMNVAAVFSPLRADPEQCEQGESPLECEYRLNNPSIAIISMEEAWAGDVEKYEKYMRQIIETTMAQGIVPVIATKADNLEGKNRINQVTARLAWEYEIPLWNFWAAVQPLSDHGLSDDGFHLSVRYQYTFDAPFRHWSGYTMRNLTALQVLDALRDALIAVP